MNHHHDRRRVNWSDDGGFAGGVEAVPFSVLVFAVGTLIVLNLWSVISTKMAVNTTARQATHMVVEAAAEPTDDDVRAAARDTLRTFVGKEPDENALAVDLHLPEGWARCAPVEVTVTYRAPLVVLPLVGQFDGFVAVSSSSSSLIDPYRVSLGRLEGQCDR